MSITLETLGLNAIDSGAYVKEEVKNSVIGKLATPVAGLPTVGLTVGQVKGITSYAVAEGAAKTASGNAKSIVLRPGKLAAVTVLTDEALSSSVAVESAVWDSMLNSQAKAFDNIALGLTTPPAEWGSDFKSLARLNKTVKVRGGANASDDLQAAEQLVDEANVTGYLVSTTFLAYLRKQRNALGTRDIEVTNDTIDGVPYVKFNSNVAVGYAGNWNRAWFSIAPFESPSTGSAFRIASDGNIKDDNGVDHNLTAENKIALFREDLIAFNYDEGSFVKLVPAEETPNPGGKSAGK